MCQTFNIFIKLLLNQILLIFNISLDLHNRSFQQMTQNMNINVNNERQAFSTLNVWILLQVKQHLLGDFYKAI